MPNTTLLGFKGPTAASRAMVAVAATIVMALFAVTFASIWQRHGQAEHAARQNADSAALALAAHAHQVFSSADYVLQSLVQSFEEERIDDVAVFKLRFGDEATHALLRNQARSFQAFDVLSVVAVDGDLVNFSRGYPVPSMNIREREGVGASGGTEASHAMLITAPRIAVVNGRWTFYLVREVRGRNGQKLGIVQAGISTTFFSDFYRRLRASERVADAFPTVLTLMRSDGVILAETPHDDTRVGRALGDADVAQAGPYLSAVREVDAYRARVSATVYERAYLAAWRGQSMLVAALALLSSVALTVTFALMVRVLRRREHELATDRQMRVRAELADRAKSEFLSNITHELRTPMNGVLGAAELLLNERRHEQQQELIWTLIGSGRKLLAIINDILDLTKIEAGEIPVQRSAFNPRAVVEEVRGLLADAASAKGLDLRTDVRGDPPATALGDAGHVREILLRLVGNAIKFTDRGQVVVAVEGQPAGSATRSLIRYVVEDTGIGLAPEHRERLFKPFEQLDSSAQRRHEGTGLGLALAQGLAGLLQGRIDFTPREGGGTRFWFEVELPVERTPAPAPTVMEGAPAQGAADAAAGGAPAGTSPGCGGSKEADEVDAESIWQATGFSPHVLVVEDNPVNALIVQEQLSVLGCTSALASDGEDALNALREGHFDLVLMDCMLPKMSGYDVTILWRAIEHTEGLAHLPIVALTANTLASNIELCEWAGMDDFLTKPVALGRLREVLGAQCLKAAKATGVTVT